MLKPITALATAKDSQKKRLTAGQTEVKEREFDTYRAWKRAVKQLDPNPNFTGDEDIDSSFKKGWYEAEWDGAHGMIQPHPPRGGHSWASKQGTKASRVNVDDLSNILMERVPENMRSDIFVPNNDDEMYITYSGKLNDRQFRQLQKILEGVAEEMGLNISVEIDDDDFI